MNDDTETVYSVIFDKEFSNGVSFGGSPKRGYKLCRMSFINLSHAMRTGLYKPVDLKNKKRVNQTSNSEKQVKSKIILINIFSSKYIVIFVFIYFIIIFRILK